ncbi:MAG: hypothetical protein ABR915_21690 [Thermoguttaceae bacterium]|jgi:hypothetical protein
MRIALPYSDSYPYVTVVVMTPKGERTATANRSFHSFVDIELPEGVGEDEVDVYSCFLDAGRRVPQGCGPALLKAAVVRKIESVLSAVGLQAVKPTAEAAPVAELAPVVEPVTEVALTVEPIVEPIAEVAPTVEPVAEVVPVVEPAAEVAPAVEPEAGSSASEATTATEG